MSPYNRPDVPPPSEGRGAPVPERPHTPGYECDCTIETRSPSWTILPEPLQARVLKLTTNGVKAVIPNFPLSRYEKWMRHTERGDTIKATVRFDQGGDRFELKGKIVWIAYASGDEPKGDCLVGVFLKLLPPERQQELQRALREG